MLKFRSIYNYESDSKVFDQVDSVSIAVPSQSLTVREILERFRRGTISPEELVNKGFYDDENNSDLDAVDNTIEDLTDISDIIGESKNMLDKELETKH